jgi:DNA-binding ferritin-like protein (Dps family)
MVLIASILLGLGVIASTIPLLKTAFVGEIVNVQILVFSLTIIVLGVTSVIGVYYSKVKKDKIEKQLNNDFYEGYEIIKEIIMKSQLDKFTMKEIKEDILDMLISAQNGGKTFKETIGEPQKFSGDILEQYGKVPKYNVIHFLDSMLYMVLFTLGVTVVMWMQEINKGFFNIKIDASMFTLFLIISFVILPYLRVNTISKNPKLIFFPIQVAVFYVVSLVLMRKYLYQIEEIKWFLDGSINLISNPVVLIVFLLGLVGLIIAKRYLKRSQINVCNIYKN